MCPCCHNEWVHVSEGQESQNDPLDPDDIANDTNTNGILSHGNDFFLNDI